MLISATMASWLGDRDVQDRSYQGVAASARKWGRHPLMTRLERELAEMPLRTPEAILDVGRGFIGKTAEIEALVIDLIRSARADPFFRPPFYTDSNDLNAGLLLFNNADLAVALSVISVDQLAYRKSGKRGPTSLGFTGRLSLYKYLKASNATLSFWEVPRLGKDFVASQAGKARFMGRRRLRDGEEIVVDGRYQSFVVEHAESDILYFQAMAQTGAAPVAAEFDSKAFSFVGASSTDEASSRIQMLVSLLRTMERQDAMNVIEEMLNSPYFYTRWHIMREMLALDADAALPALRRMAAEDSHPEVRAAARQTLTLFFEPEAAESGKGQHQCHA
jgi:hypothetical protein